MSAPRREVPYVDIAAPHRALKAELIEAVGAVFDHGRFILGPEVERFEQEFAALCGVPYALGVNSGTDALILALRALEIGPGDEVITVPNSFVATAAAIALVGARPVFVDSGPDLNLDPAALPAALTPRTRAVLPVHLTGLPAAMDAISDFAREHDLAVIEDCAQAVGALYRGRPVGSLGRVGCFSLHPLKTLNACGDGGVITTADPDLYRRLQRLRNLGLRDRDNCATWSGNSRLDTLQAAILLVKLGYLEEWTAARCANAAYYGRALAGLPGLRLPGEPPHLRAVYHTYVVQTARRDALRSHLAASGIGTGIHYPLPIHLQEAAGALGCREGDYPVAERQAGEILSLPVHSGLTTADRGYVAAAIQSFFETAPGRENQRGS